jgi:hypothetical protein
MSKLQLDVVKVMRVWHFSCLNVFHMKTYMKKNLFVAIASIGVASLVQATTISITAPDPLSGYYAYSLGTPISIPDGQEIDSMTISFSLQLTSAPIGYLYVDLLDLAKTGTTTYTDKDGSGDYFLSSKYSLSPVTSLETVPFTKYNQTIDFSYTLTADELAALNAYTADGILDIGLDPDCSFRWHGGCTFIYTCHCHPKCVPDSAMTAGLLGMSFLGLLFFRRKLALN